MKKQNELIYSQLSGNSKVTNPFGAKNQSINFKKYQKNLDILESDFSKKSLNFDMLNDEEIKGEKSKPQIREAIEDFSSKNSSQDLKIDPIFFKKEMTKDSIIDKNKDDIKKKKSSINFDSRNTIRNGQKIGLFNKKVKSAVL